MTYVLLKLVSGEELVGESIDSSNSIETSITLKEPKQIFWGMDDDHISSRLFPFMMYSEEKTFTFDKMHIITYSTNLSKELIDTYKSSFMKSNSKTAKELLDVLKNIKPHSIN